jgi:beta-glucosidase
MNRELNASRAFVAAWLPGSEGAGVADLLFRGKGNKAAHDFTGKLSFSWPRNAAGAQLNAVQSGYDPLFALGFGRNYAATGDLSPLPEDSGAAPELMNAGSYLETGTAVAPWQLAVDGGDHIVASAVTDGVQQIAQRFVARGGDGAAVSISLRGDAPVNMTRETNGDVLLLLRLKRHANAPDDLTLTMRCGENCAGSVAIGKGIQALPHDVWQTVGVPLKCFASAGADMTRIVVPMAISSSKALDLSVARVQLGTNPPVTLGCK